FGPNPARELTFKPSGGAGIKGGLSPGSPRALSVVPGLAPKLEVVTLETGARQAVDRKGAALGLGPVKVAHAPDGKTAAVAFGRFVGILDLADPHLADRDVVD